MRIKPGGFDLHTQAQGPTGAVEGVLTPDSGVQTLDASALKEVLTRLPQWRHEPECATLTRRFVFADFAQAFGFMTEMAIWSEKNDHHPEWFNVHRRVDVSLTTHDAGGLTDRDLAWAQAADSAAARRNVLNDLMQGAQTHDREARIGCWRDGPA